MTWRPTPDDKLHGGYTLPFIALHWPSYLYFCRKYFNRWGQPRGIEVAAKARTILVPDGYRVAYRFDVFRRLERVWLVDDALAQPDDELIVLPHLDLSIVELCANDRRIRAEADQKLVRAVKRIVYGDPDSRLTEQRCQAFFDDDEKFAARRTKKSGTFEYRAGFEFWKDPSEEWARGQEEAEDCDSEPRGADGGDSRPDAGQLPGSTIGKAGTATGVEAVPNWKLKLRAIGARMRARREARGQKGFGEDTGT